MSQQSAANQYQQQSFPQGQTIQTQMAAPPPEPPQIAQPTVRVMRLYKPCMHVVSTMPPFADSSSGRPVDFAISPFLLLPDSFGDIYTGELFSAYIAVVNGNQDETLLQATLSVRLQTSNSTYDLQDCRTVVGQQSGFAKHLGPNQSVDVVVRHTLNELGTHTLRVAVQYTTRYAPSEPKTLRKFYRFNVLQPLNILANAMDLGNRLMVQCQLTNTTKSPMYIEDVSFVPYFKNAEVKAISAPESMDLTSIHGGERSSQTLDKLISSSINPSSMPLIWPEESYAYTFSITKAIGQVYKVAGYAEIKWCSYMGEHGTIRSDEAAVDDGMKPIPISPSLQSSGGGQGLLVRVDCVESPSEATVGVDFMVLLRITNNSNQPLSLRLVSRSASAAAGGRSGGGAANQSAATSSGFHAVSTGSVPSSLHQQSSSLQQYGVDAQLCVTGLATANIGLLGAGGSIDTPITVCPLGTGLQELKHLSVVDLATMVEYPAGSLCKVFVHEEESR